MPAFIKTQEDEELWNRAKAIVMQTYPKLKESDPQFWALVTTIFFKLKKGGDDNTDNAFNIFEKAEIIIAESTFSNINEYVSSFKKLRAGFTAIHSLLEFDKPNLNKDVIPLDSKEIMLEGIVGQACTWEHYPDIIIGSVIDAQVFDNKLIVMTKFWADRPLISEFVDDIKQRYQDNNLKFSFEILAKKVKCSKCGSIYDARLNGGTDHYCDCLKNRFKTDVSRVIIDYIPIGEGVVTTPAYKESKTYIASSYNLINRLSKLVDDLSNKINKAMR